MEIGLQKRLLICEKLLRHATLPHFLTRILSDWRDWTCCSFVFWKWWCLTVWDGLQRKRDWQKWIKSKSRYHTLLNIIGWPLAQRNNGHWRRMMGWGTQAGDHSANRDFARWVFMKDRSNNSKRTRRARIDGIDDQCNWSVTGPCAQPVARHRWPRSRIRVQQRGPAG